MEVTLMKFFGLGDFIPGQKVDAPVLRRMLCTIRGLDFEYFAFFFFFYTLNLFFFSIV